MPNRAYPIDTYRIGSVRLGRVWVLHCEHICPFVSFYVIWSIMYTPSMCAKLSWSLYICVHFSVLFICFVQVWLIYKSLGLQRNYLWALQFSWTFWISSIWGDTKSPPWCIEWYISCLCWCFGQRQVLLVPGTPHTEGSVGENLNVSKMKRTPSVRALAVSCWVQTGYISTQ